jgi:hypothetical protein
LDSSDHLTPNAIAPPEPEQPGPPPTAVQRIDDAWAARATTVNIDGPEFAQYWDLHTEDPQFVAFCESRNSVLGEPIPLWFERGAIALLQRTVFQWEMSQAGPGLLAEARAFAANQTACAQARAVYGRVAASVAAAPRNIPSLRGYLVVAAKNYRNSEFRELNRGALLLADDYARSSPHGAESYADAPDQPRDARELSARLFGHPDVVARPLVARLMRLRILQGILPREDEAAALGVSVAAIKHAREYLRENYARLRAYATRPEI